MELFTKNENGPAYHDNTAESTHHFVRCLRMSVIRQEPSFSISTLIGINRRNEYVVITTLLSPTDDEELDHHHRNPMMKITMALTYCAFLVRQRALGFSSQTTKATLRFQSTRMFSSSGVSPADVNLMKDILFRVREINKMPENINLLDFRVDGMTLGKVTTDNADLLCSIPNDQGQPVFAVHASPQGTPELTLTPSGAGTSFESRTQAVATVMEAMRDQGVIAGWRDEAFPVSTSFYEQPLFVMERAAVPFLGVLEYGVHVNGLVRDEQGDVKMWIGRRSATKSKFPGMLDHIVAGGQPAGLSLMDNVIKECMEEASIPEEMTKAGVRPAGAISYETFSERTGAISRVVLFNYDLYLPKDFVPKPMDGEVEEFFLWSIDDILESLRKEYPDPIKPNCYVVIIDYLLREGHLSPQVPGYLDVLRELRSGDCC